MVIRQGNGTEDRTYFPPPYPAIDLIAHAPTGGFAHAITSSYRVRMFDHRGTPIATVERDELGPRVAIDEAAHQRLALDSLRQWARTFQATYPRFEIPLRKPPIRNIWYDRDGRLWVQLERAFENTTESAHVYSAAGELLFLAEWPERIELAHGAIRGRVGLGVAPLAYGVESVVRLEFLPKNSGGEERGASSFELRDVSGVSDRQP
ncbi:MAG: hypothetical protein MJB57_11670 [Gemmatimonadetes bacterium]|nr:hypothetical protein [Gemmatimonadota bacterium]